MGEQSRSRRSDFRQRLAKVRARIRAGLPERARALREAAERLADDERTARAHIRRLAHKLRGVAEAERVQQRAARLDDQGDRMGRAELRDAALALAAAVDGVFGDGAAGGDTGSARARTDARPSGQLRVLALDDDEASREVIGFALREVGGFEAVVTHDAHEALAQLQERDFDVIVVDAMMPGMDGAEFIRRTRDLEGRAARTPIVVLSAARSSEIDWNQPMRPDAWLTKPFRSKELVAELARVAAHNRSE